ncbi:MAG: serine hydrolase domain-containing protein [Candidatus Krumholzibacteriia bacterium]
MMTTRWFPLCAVALAVLGGAVLVAAQDGPGPDARQAVDAVLTMLDSDGEAPLTAFVDRSMRVPDGPERAALLARLADLRERLRGLRDDVSVEGEADGVRLILAGERGEAQLRIVLGPEGIRDLSEAEAPAPLELTRGNLAATFAELAQAQLAGVVSIRLADGFVYEAAFGPADPATGAANTLSTIFGTGSRPIDYTVAAILLLEQQGRLTRDQTIDAIIPDVPADKRAITIAHLLDGRSGLPDFFHTAADWDPDLAWIDRRTAERRLLASPLRFAPGEGREHSHGAFVLLAAVIERVSGQPYYEFIREHLLDPAGMARTGEYGETRGLALADFAVGGGPMMVGLPNIPPNWGPVSWLIKGSGGMYSTLGDLRRFYEFVRSGRALDPEHARPFLQPAVSADGSDRGFELFSAYDPAGSEAYLFLNAQGDRSRVRPLFRALERFVMPAQP